jgi:hypothetical protein
MSYDPNWFYSSLAQCAAAVVGLLGAVLTTRIQQQLTGAHLTYEEVAGQVRELRATIRSREKEVQNFLTFVDRRIPEIQSALDQSSPEIHVNEEVELWGSSRSGSSAWPIWVDQSVLENYEALRTPAKDTLAVNDPCSPHQTCDAGGGPPCAHFPSHPYTTHVLQPCILGLQEQSPENLRSVGLPRKPC